MDRLGILIVCAPLFAVSAFIVGRVLRVRRAKPVHRCLLFTGAMMLCWQAAYMLEVCARREAVLRYLYSLSAPFAALTSLGALLLVVYFYGLEGYLNRPLIAIMGVLPAMTAVIAFAGDPFGLIFAQLEVLRLDPVYRVAREPGMWFWAHLVYCYLLNAVSAYLAVSQHVRLPRSFRVCSTLIIGAMVVSFGTNLISMTVLADSPLSLNVVGTTLSLVLLYVAMSNNERMDYLMLARSHIFDQLDVAVFILDSDRRVVECNHAAADCLELWTGKREADSMEEVLDTLLAGGARIEDPVRGERGRDIFLSSDKARRVYNVREEALRDRGGRALGIVVTCTDVTQNRKLIAFLEKSAGTDAMTGLPNRSSLMLQSAGFEADEALPLSVVVGDVNGLKEVNDSLGHRHGDDLIRLVAATLARCCPPQGTVFRTGGDEFLMVLPHTDQAQAQAAIARIRESLGAVEGYPFRPSIALGSATRTGHNLSLDGLVHQADRNMYGNKGSRRR